MKVGLLGFSQAGKKTLFHLLTRREVPPGRREDEVIEGQAPVRDPRVDRIAAIAQPEKTRYAETTFALCPDLEQGSAKRLWLEEARKCECLCLVVRAFSDASVYHPAGSVDAERDRADLEAELLLADMELVEKRLERIAKEKRAAGRTQAQEQEEKALAKCNEALEAEHRLRDVEFDEYESAAIKSLGLLTLKPVIWTYNVDESAVADGYDPLTIACKIEEEIMGIDDPAERTEFLGEMGLTASGVDRMNAAAYDRLGLMSFYTMGKDEVRAWTIRKGESAPSAAGKIHSDIERGFIRAEVIKYNDLMAAGSEAAAKEQGKALLKGKDYVMEDGDICNFRFNV